LRAATRPPREKLRVPPSDSSSPSPAPEPRVKAAISGQNTRAIPEMPSRAPTAVCAEGRRRLSAAITRRVMIEAVEKTTASRPVARLTAAR
jgi:hypothetical protein